MEVSGYPAFFDYCSPADLIALAKTTGFRELEMRYYYKATDYFAFFVPLYLVVAMLENFCRLMRLNKFCSGILFIARK